MDVATRVVTRANTYTFWRQNPENTVVLWRQHATTSILVRPYMMKGTHKHKEKRRLAKPLR